MSATDYGRTPAAEQRRLEKARRIARWCYWRGIGPSVAEQDSLLLRSIARHAGVLVPHVDAAGGSPTWRLVADLLHARAGWDRAHGDEPPPHVLCIGCAVLQAPCKRCAAPTPPRCRGCDEPLDPGLAAAGLELHPTCPPPAASLAPPPQPELPAPS